MTLHFNASPYFRGEFMLIIIVGDEGYNTEVFVPHLTDSGL